MASDYYEAIVGVPDFRLDFVKFVGGTTAVTKVAGTGEGVTVTYAGVGLVNLTWSLNALPGTFLGVVSANFEATVPSALRGYSCIPGVYNVATRTLQLAISGTTDVLVDLAALQWLTVVVAFKAGQA